jgi:hypothetical protein
MLLAASQRNVVPMPGARPEPEAPPRRAVAAPLPAGETS